MKLCKLPALVLIFLWISCPWTLAEEDTPDSQDHPLLSRMPGYYIESYEQKDFDSFEFFDKVGNYILVEGRKTHIHYRPKEGTKVPSPLQVARNYQNAVTRVGGTILYNEVSSGGGSTSMKLVRGREEVWIMVSIGDSGNNYNVAIVEKGGMDQVVTANADAWKSDLGSTGHAAVYGILFDTGKAELKPESEPALQEIARLMRQDPRLSLMVVGHTDLMGEIPQNMVLSEARAKAVVVALTSRFGVAAARLSAYGCGPLAPVASNQTEEGRAKNRRVELVQK